MCFYAAHTHTHTHTHTHMHWHITSESYQLSFYTHILQTQRNAAIDSEPRFPPDEYSLVLASKTQTSWTVHGSIAQLPVALPFPTRQNFYFTSRVLEDASAQAVKRGSLHFVPFPLSLSSLPSCFLHHHLFFVFFFLFSPFFPSSFRLLFFSPFPSSSPSSSSTYFTSSAPSILLLHPLLIL